MALFDDLVAALTGDRACDAADSLLGVLLAAAGIWESARTSDGVLSCRVVNADESSLLACGKVWEISQVLERYCFELLRDGDQLRWTVHYAVPDDEPRHRRAVDLIEATDPLTLAWRASASGVARMADHALVDVVVK